MTREEAREFLLSIANKLGYIGVEDLTDRDGKRMIEAIKALEEPQWIPCSERLPEEDGGLYLITDYAKSINRRRIHLSRCYMNKDYFWSDVLLGYKVVAWMPLPEPARLENV